MSNIDISAYEKLPETFYTRDDVVQIARDLIGKFLISKIDGELAIGKIVETEAYNGRMDKACHAYHKRTPRTEVMYDQGGKAYVYLCYGVHHLFNVVTNVSGLADAVLIRGLEPVAGLDVMKIRTGKHKDLRLASGPGVLSKAMGITTHWDGTSLQEERIWIAERKMAVKPEIETDIRIGVDYAGEDALLPWRFLEKGSKFVSKGKKKP